MNEYGSDPSQLYEDEASELGRLVRRGRSRGPSDTAVRRIGERLAASGAIEAARAQREKRSSGRYAVYVLGAGALMGLLGWAVFGEGRAASSTVPEVDVRVDGVPLAVGSKAPSEHPAVAPSTEIPSVPVEALPSFEARPTPAPARSPAVVTSRAETAIRAPASSSDSSEFVLVQRAQQALASDPARALAVTDEQARAYPAGDLVQEREVLAVEALVRLGRRTEAKVRADALLRRFPNTAYVLRLAHAIGEPPAPAATSATHR